MDGEGKERTSGLESCEWIKGKQAPKSLFCETGWKGDPPGKERKKSQASKNTTHESQTVLASCFGPPCLAAADCCCTPLLPSSCFALFLLRSLWLLSPIRYRMECFLIEGEGGRRRRAPYAHSGHTLPIPRPQVAFTHPCCCLLQTAPYDEKNKPPAPLLPLALPRPISVETYASRVRARTVFAYMV